MHELLHHDQRLKILPFGAIDNIRKLKLNNKPIKSKCGQSQCQESHQTGSNSTNIIKINKVRFKSDSRIIFTTANVQSIRYKELQVSQLISDYSLDFIVLTETLLNINHNLWKDTCTLNKAQLRLHTADWKECWGGGLALINRSHYPCRNIHSGTKLSFEFAAWELRIKSTVITIHGIYHPPYSLTNKTTNGRFIEEFTEYVSTNLAEHQNNIFIGNFNLHVSDALDTDSAIFNDTVEALGLYQYVGFSTHQSGNVLDLVLSDITSETNVLTTAPGPFISDHWAVIGMLSIKRLRLIADKKLVRQTSKVSDSQWGEEFNPDNIVLNGKFDKFVSTFNPFTPKTFPFFSLIDNRLGGTYVKLQSSTLDQYLMLSTVHGYVCIWSKFTAK